jgi:TIGR03009 family protein
MRSAGVALLAVAMGFTTAAASGRAQQPVVPATGAVPQSLPAAVAAPDQKLEAHLAGWEKRMQDLGSFRFDLALERNDPAAGIFKGKATFTGSVLCMKPNLARLRLDNAADPKDFEAYICNGKSVYAYNGLQKTITEHKLPDPKTNPGGGTDNLILDFVSGMKAKDLKDRFDLTIFKEDADYIYLDIQPRLGKDKQDFKQLRLALYQPKHVQVAYLPAQIRLVRTNGETEEWRLSNPKTEIAGLDRRVFEREDVPGFRFQLAPDQKAAPVVRPGQPTPPVRPGRP